MSGVSFTLCPIYRRWSANNVLEYEVEIVPVPIWMQCLNTPYAGYRKLIFQLVFTVKAGSFHIKLCYIIPLKTIGGFFKTGNSMSNLNKMQYYDAL